MTVLYHYTCVHGRDGIEQSGWILPHIQPILPGRPALVWLTDLDHPFRNALGLTSDTLRCDRTAHHYLAATARAVHWPVYAQNLTPTVRAALETAPGALPAHWWVCEHRIAAIPAGPAALATFRRPK